MEETKKTARNKKIDNKISKFMSAITSETIRGIILASNELDIKKEDIVSLLKENGQFVLIYFK